MTREDIFKMARDAATEDGSTNREDGKNTVLYAAKTNQFLERFAALVAAAEREACAKVCETVSFYDSMGPMDCADMIRARGEE